MNLSQLIKKVEYAIFPCMRRLDTALTENRAARAKAQEARRVKDDRVAIFITTGR